MIRRQTIDRDGSEAWLLISQIEHAHLAAALAESWGAPPFDPLPGGDELQRAIYHHDDGWAQWDARPEVDDAGRPVEFTEMRTRDALDIWRKSIASSEKLGQLAPYVVSGHFCALIKPSDAQRREPESAALAAKFLQEQQERQTDWLAAWLESNPRSHLAETAACAVESLRFFDRLSLWLSCAPRSQPSSFVPPQGPKLEFAPKSTEIIEVSPWPWRVKRLQLSIQGRLVPAKPFDNAESLTASKSRDANLTWRLTPDRNEHR